jgi:tagaturonate reductase
MSMRNIPVIKKYFEKFGTAPAFIALGFAAFLVFMKAEEETNGEFTGKVNNKNYPINDDNALLITEKWQRLDTGAFVNEVMRDEKLWETDLSRLQGFSDAVTDMIHALQKDGALATLKKIVSIELAQQP